jgi:predicted pyridoxine 5'-phosphate oxidase superfamily flavin-nucleotide-binding protein
VSPKGEDGSVAIFDGDDRLIIAERPGNQRHDTFRNIIDQPDVALFFLIRGQDRAAYVRGKMTLMMDENFQSALISGGRPARAVCVIDIKSLEMTASLGLARARFWDPSTWPRAATLPSIGQIMHDHIKLHRDRSAAAEDVRAGLNHEDLDASAQADYRDNL